MTLGQHPDTAYSTLSLFFSWIKWQSKASNTKFTASCKQAIERAKLFTSHFSSSGQSIRTFSWNGTAYGTHAIGMRQQRNSILTASLAYFQVLLSRFLYGRGYVYVRCLSRILNLTGMRCMRLVRIPPALLAKFFALMFRARLCWIVCMYCIALRSVRFRLVARCVTMGSFAPIAGILLGSGWDLHLDCYTTHVVASTGLPVCRNVALVGICAARYLRLDAGDGTDSDHGILADKMGRN